MFKNKKYVRTIIRIPDDMWNEIADKINLNQKTVQGALLELANTKKNIKWKKVGRYRLFWKVK
jgi:hypothetical protein